jgi:hypothetical protein
MEVYLPDMMGVVIFIGSHFPGRHAVASGIFLLAVDGNQLQVQAMNLVDNPDQRTLVLDQPFDDRFITIQAGNRHAIKPILPTIMKHALNADGVVFWKLFHTDFPEYNDGCSKMKYRLLVYHTAQQACSSSILR